MIPNSWLVILDGAGDREELITGVCPGLWIQYGQHKWHRQKANDFLRIAVYGTKESPKVPA